MKHISEIIYGDTIDVQIGIDEGEELISKMYFSCASLDISQEMMKTEENNKVCYVTSINPDLVPNYKPGYISFDITVQLTDGSMQTIMYNEPIYIYPKVNKVKK